MKLHLMNKVGMIGLTALMIFTGCSATDDKAVVDTTIESTQVANEMLTLEDIDKEDFKPTAKVSYTIEGKVVSKREEVTNVLEGADYIAEPEVDVILKGTVGEPWVTPMEKVLKTYTKVDGSELTAEDFEPDTYITLQTKAGKPVFAAFVPKETQVEIHTAWGDILIANRPEVEHGEGDYIVCDAGEDGAPNFEDVWVVNGKVFETTYDMSQMK